MSRPISARKKDAIRRKLAKITLPSIPGIYLIEFRGESYVGQSTNIRRRLQTHVLEAHYRTHANYKLQAALTQLTEWRFQILEPAPPLSKENLGTWLLLREAFWIELKKSKLNLAYSSVEPLVYDFDATGIEIRRIGWAIRVYESKIYGHENEIDRSVRKLEPLMEIATLHSNRISTYEARGVALRIYDSIFWSKDSIEFKKTYQNDLLSLAKYREAANRVECAIQNARFEIQFLKMEVRSKKKRHQLLVEIKDLMAGLVR